MLMKSLSRRFWLWYKNVPGARTAFGEGPIGRALAAFSYIFDESQGDGSQMSLLWAVLGLEAIYGRDSTGILDQLRKKSELLLGSCDQNKKLLAAAHDFRSRFIHGDIDFPFQYCTRDASPNYEQFGEKGYDAAVYAITVLVASLQALCCRGMTDIRFRWEIADSL
jgi:hypothetical protein